MVASNIDITHDQRLEILDELNVMKRMEALSVMLGKTMQIVSWATGSSRMSKNV